MGKITDKGFTDLTALIFESAADPTGAGWAEVYARLSGVIGSGPGSLSVFNKREPMFTPLADTNEPGFLDDLNRIYFRQLPYKNGFTTLRSGDHLHRRREISDRCYAKTSIYQDHFRRFGLFHLSHYCVLDDADAAALVTFSRPETMSDFGRENRAFITKVMPVLQRAMRLHVKVLDTRRRDRLVLESWDRLAQGVILVSETGRVAYANASGERILRSKCGLSIGRGGKLTSAGLSLRAAIRSAIAPDGAVDCFPTGLLSIDGPNGKLPLSLLIVPFRDAAGRAFGSERYAAIFVSDPNAEFSSIGDSLVQAYDLTGAEANVAQRLAEGLSMTEIGDDLSITQNTVKTHLKHIFTKTGTHRQSSLIKLLLHIPRTIDRANLGALFALSAVGGTV